MPTPAQRREYAQQTGVNEQYLYQCLTGRRDMNPGEARRVETETGGAITRRQLCQKTWRQIWPELESQAAKPMHRKVGRRAPSSQES